MVTAKKLTPVKRTAKKDAKPGAKTTAKTDVDINSAILAELKTHTEYLHRMDWKLWVIMGMIKLIGEENGYTFKAHQQEGVEREIDVPSNIKKLVDNDKVPWEEQEKNDE